MRKGSINITYTGGKVRYMQRGDQETSRIIDLLGKPMEDRSKYERSLVSGFKLSDGVLYRIHGNRDLFVIPKYMRKGVVIIAHDMAGHRALEQTIRKIMEDYWFARMKRYVRMHIGSCIDCMVNKKAGGKTQGLLHTIPPENKPFSVVHMDHLGPFEKGTKGNKYLLVIIDNLTKYVSSSKHRHQSCTQ